jgi:hypothetical protein
MPEADLFLLFVRPLNRVGVKYALTGSVAAIFYGEPRLTHDADFVVLLNETQIQGLGSLFVASDFYVPPSEVIALEAERESRGHFNIIHINSGFKADFYFVGDDPLNRWALADVQKLEFQGECVRLAPPEYIIVRKLEYYREGQSQKHLRDIRSILKISGENLNRDVLDRWIKRLGLKDQWREVHDESSNPGGR